MHNVLLKLNVEQNKGLYDFHYDWRLSDFYYILLFKKLLVLFIKSGLCRKNSHSSFLWDDGLIVVSALVIPSL